jgi:hypothetical protein
MEIDRQPLKTAIDLFVRRHEEWCVVHYVVFCCCGVVVCCVVCGRLWTLKCSSFHNRGEMGEMERNGGVAVNRVG